MCGAFPFFLAFFSICLSLRAQSPAGSSEESTTKSSVEAVYTDLTGGKCRTIEFHATGANSTQSCPGVAGYKLRVLDSDSRMSVTIVSPSGQQYPLRFWQTVTPYFSELGRLAEWRVTKRGNEVVPIALITRLNIKDEDPQHTTSYLVVSKISRDGSCVVDKLAGNEANEAARRSADSAASRPCLEDQK